MDQLLAAAREGLRRLTPAEAHDAMRRGAVIVDVRSDRQREQDGVVPCARHVPRNVLEWRCDPACPHRDPALARPGLHLIVMCNEGYQSSLAAATLQRLGLTQATDLIGGFQAWRATGLPVARPHPSRQREPGAYPAGSPVSTSTTSADGMVDALDPQRLRLLVELKRQGSISAAAEACRMGQPSATKHLKTLEAATGERLVEREGRGSRLTAAGEVVAAHAQRVLDTLEGMQAELRALRDAELGTLTLAASTMPGSYVLPSILECFAERHPRVDVEVVIGSSTWVAQRVARREVSLGLAGELDWPDGVVAEPFLEDEIVGIVAPGRLRDRGDVTLADLRTQTLFVREPGSSTRAVADRHLARVAYRPAKRWELDSSEAIKRSVRAGLGIGFVSRLVVAEELERGELEAFEIAGVGPMRRAVYLLRPDGRDPVPAERAFIQTLCACCSASVAGCAV